MTRYNTFCIEVGRRVMNKFEINDIIKGSSSLTTYEQGIKFYKMNRIYSLEKDEERECIFAKVDDTYRYELEIYFTQGKIASTYCNCEDYQTKRGYCRHLVAVLVSLKMPAKETIKQVDQEIYPISEIIDYYVDNDSFVSSEKVNVKAEYTLSLDTYYQKNTLSLKLGAKQLYVLKNPEEFFQAVDDKSEYEFGKKFTFDPYGHEFFEKDEKILSIVKNIVDDQRYYNLDSFTYNKSTIIKGKELSLTNRDLKSILQILNGDQIDLNINGNLTKAKITVGDIYLPFELFENNNKLELSLKSLDKLIPMTDDYSVLYKDASIYYISSEQREDLLPLFKAIDRDVMSVSIDKKSLNMFMSYLYPTLKKTCEVKISKEVEKKLYLKKCEAKLYLDVDGDGIRVNLKYAYGDYIYDSFNGLETEKSKDLIVLRDMKFENNIMSILENSELRVSKYGYHIENEYEVYQFFKYGLPRLKDMISIYYSEGFEKIDIKNHSSISISSSLDESMNYFSFKFSVDGIDTSEIADIIDALKEKKNYYRLNNGSFLTLDGDVLTKFSKVMDDLLIEGKDFENGQVMISNNRAFYLNDVIEEFTLDHFKRNLLFKELILRVKSPEDEFYDIPSEVRDILRPYQVTGYNWLKTLSRYNFGGILADDMGLGKTLQVLSFIKSNLADDYKKKSLIVAPTSLVYNWLNEVKKFLPDLRVLVIDGPRKFREEKLKHIDEYNIVITSYALVRNDIDLYNDIKIDLMIIDEAQHIKNPLSKTSKAIKSVNASSKFALTGTPIENSVLELWSIFDFIMPGYMQSLGKFKKTYEKPVKDGDKETLSVLKKMISPFIMRRLKKDVLKELPDKIENQVVVDLNEEQKLVYMAYLDKVKGDLEESYKTDGFNKSRMKVLAALTRLRQICCDPSLFLDNYEGRSSKLELLEELLDELLEGGHRVLIFSQFTSMLAKIKDMLIRKDISYYSIDGSTKAIKRNEMVDEFNKGENSVFLISLKAGGVGLNLTGADTVIHFDPWWNPAVEDQATDRAYRIGQEKKVHVMKLVTRGTIEEKIYDLQEKKRQIIEKVIEPGETMITQMSENDIRDLFE